MGEVVLHVDEVAVGRADRVVDEAGRTGMPANSDSGTSTLPAGAVTPFAAMLIDGAGSDGTDVAVPLVGLADGRLDHGDVLRVDVPGVEHLGAAGQGVGRGPWSCPTRRRPPTPSSSASRACPRAPCSCRTSW